MLIFEYPFWIISIDQCFKQKNTINNKIHRYYQTEITPYCNGQWSSTDGKISKFLVIGVLILVVVDNGLVRHLVTMFSLMLKKVLILVVVDDGLVHYENFSQKWRCLS